MVDIRNASKAHVVEVVLLLSNTGKFSELHFGQLAKATFNGVGGVCTSVFVFVHLPDTELPRSSIGLCDILCGVSLTSTEYKISRVWDDISIDRDL